MGCCLQNRILVLKYWMNICEQKAGVQGMFCLFHATRLHCACRRSSVPTPDSRVPTPDSRLPSVAHQRAHQPPAAALQTSAHASALQIHGQHTRSVSELSSTSPRSLLHTACSRVARASAELSTPAPSSRLASKAPRRGCRVRPYRLSCPRR
jgi:hypothetical protein